MTDALYPSRDGFDGKPDYARARIRWQATDLSADFFCSCGAEHHIDSDCVCAVKCTCGKVWELPHTVAVKEVEDGGLYYLCDYND